MSEDLHLEVGQDWFNNILIHAIQTRASDIHLEPEREGLGIRLRIDGLLH